MEPPPRACTVPRRAPGRRRGSVLSRSWLTLLHGDRAEVADLAGLQVVDGDMGLAPSTRSDHVEPRPGDHRLEREFPVATGLPIEEEEMTLAQHRVVELGEIVIEEIC